MELGLKYALGYVISQHQNISRIQSSLLCLFLKNNTCVAADNWLFLEAHFVTTVNNALGKLYGLRILQKNDFFIFFVMSRRPDLRLHLMKHWLLLICGKVNNKIE